MSAVSHRADDLAHVEPQDDNGDLVRLVARAPVRRDLALPILIGVSLLVHVTIILPYLLRNGDTAPAPQEIPVEIVQLPPKAVPKPPPPKAQAPKPPAPKPPAAKPQAAKPQAPKPQAPKPQAAKSAQPKPPQPKPPEAKPAAPKPRAEKPAPPKPQHAAEKPPPRPQSASVSDRLQQLLGGMPAIALPGATADGTDEVSYAQLVLSKVAKAKKEGRYPGAPGATSVAFTVGDSGEVASVSIVRPSGERWLDDEAMAMVRRAAPFPPPPPGGRRDFTITLRFQPVI